VPEDDGGITIIPIGPGSGAAARSAQFASETADFLRRFANNPAALVISVVSGFVVSVILGFFRFLVGAVLYPFDLLVGGLRFILVGTNPADNLDGLLSPLSDFIPGGVPERIPGLLDVFGALGLEIQLLLLRVQGELIGIVEQAGPAGPLIAGAALAITLFVLYRLALAGLEVVPGGSSILALLGGR